MTPFLQSVASDLYTKTGGRFDNLTIIFPNKRASLFFNQYLSQLSGGRPMWLPRYVTIAELFASLSPLTLCDPITAVCRLYRAYRSVTHTAETLDRFYSWGEVLLSDFDDIDNNMINPRSLFANAADLSDMTDFSFLSEAQREAISTYFDKFNADNHTLLKQKFTSLWSVLLPVYETFRADLLSAGLAYEGMLKRSVAEQLLTLHSSLLTPHSSPTYAIVGLNVLNSTEKALFKHLKQHHTTHFYWDYDNTTPSADNFEAYRFIKDNIIAFGNAYMPHPDGNNSSLPTPHSLLTQVRIISTTTEDSQARHVSQWLTDTLRSNPDLPLNRTAVVLCNESILQSVVHSIPSVSNNSSLLTPHSSLSCNITMGLPLTETAASSFLHAALRLQIHGRAHGAATWHHDAAVRLLRHPFVTDITGGESATIITRLKQQGIVYPRTDQLTDQHPFLVHLFSQPSDNAELLRYLATAYETIGKSFAPAAETDFLSQMHIESVFNIYTIINRLTAIYQSGILDVNPSTLSRLLLQAVATKSVPFHGEPATGIQIMGMLETRNLDFDHLVILSANEGNLPKSEHITSLIPYTLREAHGMTTMEARTSLYAYYFHRLLRRARTVDILYNTACDKTSRGEMSRFLLQLILEPNPAYSITLHTLIAPSAPMQPLTLHATKTADTLRRINDKFNATDSHTKAKSISPTALNTYIDCPLKFYLARLSPIALAPLDEVDEDIDNALFGNIVHHVLEAIYTPYLHRTVTADILERTLKDKTLLRRLVDKELAEAFFPGSTTAHRLTGQQLLNRHVILTYLERQLRSDINACPIRIEGIEDDTHRLLFKIDQQTAIILSGTIDRLDTATIDGEPRLRVIDYKTSSKAHETKTIDQLFDPAQSHRPYHILQALLYSLILAEEGKSRIAPSLFYLKKGIQTAPLDSVISIGKDKITDFTSHTEPDGTLIADTLADSLRSALTPLFAPDAHFSATTNTDLCQYCDFKELCTTFNSITN